MKRWNSSFLGLVLLSIVACGSEPVPRVAAAGTTISIAIPPTYAVGFGHALSDQMDRFFLTTDLEVDLPYPTGGSPAEDEARGELVFSLYGGAGNFRTYLPVRYVTRVRLDENSSAAVDLDTGFSSAQTIALVDIPAQVPVPNNYTIKVERYRRSTSSHEFVQEQPQLEDGDWVGWGQRDSNQVPYSDPHLRIPIRIVAGSGAKHNDFIGWTVAADGTLGSQSTWETESGDAQDDARDIVPSPSFLVRLHNPFGENPPGAVEFIVQYPRQTIEILGVQLNRPQRSSALALLTPDTADAPQDCTPQTGLAIVKVVDPEAATSSVAISYRLRNFEDEDCGRLSDSLSGVTIQSGSVRSFDTNGVEIGPTMVFVAGPTI